MEKIDGVNIKDFVGKKYKATDGSAIYFGEDGNFIWYQSDKAKEDNYYSGPYEFYFAKAAVDYIVNDLPQYEVTVEKLNSFFKLNQRSTFYQLSNFCCMILHNEEIKMNGEYKKVEFNKSYYMGFYADDFYDAANMQTGNYTKFTKV